MTRCERCGRRDRLHTYEIGDTGLIRPVVLCDLCYQTKNHGFWYETVLTRIK